MNELLDEIIKLSEGKAKLRKASPRYGREIEEELTKLESLLSQDKNLIPRYSSRWLAIKLLEKDKEVMEKVKESPCAEEVLSRLEKSTEHLKEIFGDTPESIIADRRYGFISGACSESVKKLMKCAIPLPTG